MAKGSLPFRIPWEVFLQCPTCLAFPASPCNDNEDGMPCGSRPRIPPNICGRFPVGSYVRLRRSPDIGQVVAHVKKNLIRVRWRNGHATEVDLTGDGTGAPVDRAEPDAFERLSFLTGEQPV